jgi:hypothetical protein
MSDRQASNARAFGQARGWLLGISPSSDPALYDEVGTTPARYVEQVRMEAAQAMLETGDAGLAVRGGLAFVMKRQAPPAA